MYPFLRTGAVILRNLGKPRLQPFDTHIAHLRCWPWDLDPFFELNNGRTLTLFDIGRFGLLTRMKVVKRARALGWRVTVAGASVRYRRRIGLFQRLEMRSRILGWDSRFIYCEQGMWHRGDCTTHILLRLAALDKDGLIPPQRVADQLLDGQPSPALPDWVRSWIAAEGARAWPPRL